MKRLNSVDCGVYPTLSKRPKFVSYGFHLKAFEKNFEIFGTTLYNYYDFYRKKNFKSTGPKRFFFSLKHFQIPTFSVKDKSLNYVWSMLTEICLTP